LSSEYNNKSNINYFCVGVGRSGTSTLYTILRDNTDINTGNNKELNFFIKRNINYHEFSNYFQSNKSNKIIDISPSYFGVYLAAFQIYKYDKNSKIIILTRDPFERFESQYKHHLKFHQIEDFNQYCKIALENISPEKLYNHRYDWYHPSKNLDQSLYFNYINNYISLFGRKSVLVLDYNVLVNNPKIWLKRIFDFLEIKNLKIEIPHKNHTQKINLDIEINIKEKILSLFNIDSAKLLSLRINNSWLERYL